MPKSDLLSGPDYAPVADRIALFYERYPDGRIVTHLTMHNEREIMFRASVYRDARSRWPASTGWASERVGDGDINTVACLENTETSAIGRALANLGFTAARNRPSREEMEKAARARYRRLAGARSPQAANESAEDFLQLLRVAERCGLRPRRAAWLRNGLSRGLLAGPHLDRLSRTFRRWVADDFARVIQP